MSRKLLWKVLVIVGAIALCVIPIYPPKEKIKLGLDLRGGAHIVMQVDTRSAIAYETGLTQTRLGQSLKEKGIAYTAIADVAPATLEIQGVDPSRSSEVRTVMEEWAADWSVSTPSPATWRLSMPPAIQSAVERSAIEQTLTTLRTRVDALGVTERVVQQQGARGDRILILLPGVEDPERIKDILQDPAVLEWKAVTYPPGVTDTGGWIPPASREEAQAQFGGTLPADTALYEQRIPQTGGGNVSLWWPLKRVSVVAGKDLRSARRGSDQFGGAAVDFTLTADAGNRFEAATREYVGKKMAIVLGSATRDDKLVLSAPVIRGVIRDSGQIEGGFDVQEAEDLALKLRSGAIPAAVKIIEERTVGPSLGRDSIRAGVLSGLVGFCLVMVFMVIYYRLSGLNAVVALALNVPLLLGAMAYFGAALSLPGIAGLVLTLGMAVDANVLIFERIREELRAGKKVRSAVDQGFSRAFMTILDCHVTTLVSAFFLFFYGTGPVQGFAVTLTIGLIISMFTAVFVSRTIYDFVLGEGRPVESLSI